MIGPVRAAAELAWAAGRARMLLRIVLTAAGASLPVLVAWLTKAVLDGIAGPGAAPLVPAVLLGVAGVASAFLPEAMQYVEGQQQRAVGLVARSRLYAAVTAMTGLRRFEDPPFHDRLTLASEAGSAGPSEVVGGALGGVQGVLAIAGFLATLALISPWMLLPVGVAGGIALVGQLRLSRFRAQVISTLGHATRRETFYAQLMTSVSAAKELRLFGLGGLFRLRMLGELRRINDGHRTMARRELAVQGVYGVLGAAVAGGGLVWAVSAPGFTVGDISLFVLAVAGVQAGLTIVIHSIGRVHEAMLLFGHYRFVVGAGPDLPDGHRAVPPLRHGIELRDVWFRYAEDLPWVLRGVSLTIPAGAATALVGPNGSGKTTLVKLLCRFYDPTRGELLWDGVPLQDLPVAQLRERLGCVFQDFMAYDLSAAENIGVGDATAIADRARIVDAAGRAGCAADLERLPRGFDTMLSRMFDPMDREGSGVLLSGGQWQRVAIARALIRDRTDLVILDEPSSGLDAEAEHEVHERLREHRFGRTSLLISHRLGTVRDADTIVVLEQGSITEQGTHDELMTANGRYTHLFTLQARRYRPTTLTTSTSEP